MIKLLASTFSLVHFFSAFSFLHPKFFGFRLSALGFRLAIQLWLLFSSKIKKNRQKAKNWRKIKLLAFRFHHQNFFSTFCFQLFTPQILWLSTFSSWLSANFPALPLAFCVTSLEGTSVVISPRHYGIIPVCNSKMWQRVFWTSFKKGAA